VNRRDGKSPVRSEKNGKPSTSEYGGRGRDWHPDFVKYAEKIVNHPNYAGMPGGVVEDGKIRWNAPSHRPPGTRWSNLHDERLEWWRKKAKSLGIPLESDWISKTAKTIHPYGKKPCQTCGREMSIAYVYPTRNTVKKINDIKGVSLQLDYHEFRDVLDIIADVEETAGRDGVLALAEILGVPESEALSARTLREYVKKSLIPSSPKGVLSPGSMSNAPDRFDGFHSYNLCCRSKQDTGRDVENLRTYVDDRRAFEWWCEGDWAAANFLMRQKASGICPNCARNARFAPDHIGPISLGFTHRPRFRPLCGPCNSSRNNRMNYDDVRILINDEIEGDKVISWHAKAIWDMYKGRVRNDEDALKLSKMMRVNQHHYLTMLWKIKKAGFSGFLGQLLHLEYADNKYSIEGFNEADFTFERLVPHHRHDTYSESKKKRFRRVAFEALDDYHDKTARNVRMVKSSKIEEVEDGIFRALKRKADKSARRNFMKYMALVAEELVNKGVPRAHWD